MHKSVLLKEIIDKFIFQDKDIIVDATFGQAGLTKKFSEIITKESQIIAIDQDASVFSDKKKLKELNIFSNIRFINDNYSNLDKILEKFSIKKVSAVIFDLGISRNQIFESGRGFTFSQDESLLMTLKEAHLIKENDLTAIEILNTWEKGDLELVFKNYGEVRSYRKIADLIVKERKKKKILTTFDLLNVLRQLNPKNTKLHFATNVFMALRIAVNNELSNLEIGLQKAFESLEENGRIFVISFHSLEDRIVKNFFRDLVKSKQAQFINKKIIKPSQEEIKENPSSRSAKLRIIEKKYEKTYNNLIHFDNC